MATKHELITKVGIYRFKEELNNITTLTGFKDFHVQAAAEIIEERYLSDSVQFQDS
ncbi:hypothetical protein KHS38_19950 [Mucilaginibacter sp. Bleaf8]|uniref:hypothetical protein n=1 Tax=Mucilaginibacter sp. Bleaf8 TaxID=2834430 RepID=UPI001BD04292|nr:hypothetical protein [Mucilaginibacter sp. Bleaf8]MBS7566688.1 hypothetical protein [Mucilaginibacter sp. Bleaf8]